MDNDFNKTKDTVANSIVEAGMGIGGTVGVAVVSVAGANVTAAATATAASAAASASVPAVFSVFTSATVINPATWAILATNPIGMAILISGGAAVGAFGCYKLAKKLLK